MTDPLNKFQLKHKEEPGRATYGENGNLRGLPTQIDDNRVVLSYYDTKPERWLPGALSVYPFKRGELKGLLKEAGFGKVTQYSDFQKGEDPQADFYEYAAEK